MDVVLDNLPAFLRGTRTTAELTVLSFLFALVLGTVVAGFRVSPVPPLRWLGTVYVEVFRNTPLLVLMFLFAFGFTKIGIQYPFFTSAIIVLSVYTGAFVAETVRAGINTVATGQAEAARALGLTFLQLLFLVVLPQAFRSVVAPLGSVFIALIKNSALAATIAVSDLTFLTIQLTNSTSRPVAVFLGSAFFYMLLALPSGWAVGWLERKLAVRR
ncbi:MAG TPA: amino acid ABC transporter permease [Acidimicrobiales bacterium]|jgi:glutamate transport system permease protein|nr:amino acid ABC transporter permease [Acidimicrobiales bacterium]